MCSLEVQESDESTQLKVLSVAPFKVNPPPSALASVGLAVSPNTIFISSTEISVEFIVVVVPFTVMSPVTVKFPLIETSPSKFSPIYSKEFQAVEPSPILNLPESDSYPGSPALKVGFALSQVAAAPLLN